MIALFTKVSGEPGPGQSGDQCKRTPIRGGSVCSMHGGAAPQVAAAAKRRLQDQLARVACWELGLPGFGGQPDAEALAAARRFRREQIE